MKYLGLLLYITLFIYQVSPLRIEGIVSGTPAHLGDFPYQVSIIGRSNDSTINQLICSGGIISQLYIISAALCFIDEFGVLKELSFNAVYRTVNLKGPNPTVRINIIYTYTPESDLTVNNIALLLLDDYLYFPETDLPLVDELDIPFPETKFTDEIGRIASYGYTWTNTINSTISGVEGTTTGGTDYLLTSIFVQVLNDTQCKQNYPEIHTYKQICGLALAETLEEHRGLCNGDNGAPLVIDNLVAGIASKHRSDCNDVINGSVYTRVAAHGYFIASILGGSPLYGTASYYNRPIV